MSAHGGPEGDSAQFGLLLITARVLSLTHASCCPSAYVCACVPSVRSKGAWGLDDYQFLIFLWGSSQLQGSTIQPADFLKEGVVESHGDSYLFLLGIRFINRMKRGPFHEHSSFLHHISTLPSWSKANGGLVKMYDAEVLAKHPIVQHVLFGRVLKFQRYDPATETLGVADAIREEEAKKEKAAARAAAMSAMAAPDNAAASAAIPTAADASNAPSDATSDK